MNKSNFLNFYIVGVICVFVIFSCTKTNEDSNINSNDNTQLQFTDPRDGQQYPYVKIGNKYWMTKNLNFNTNESWCYENLDTNCEIYGKLYTWNAAVNAAPMGWHLPTKEEWQDLISTLGTKKNAGGAMKSLSNLWLKPNLGAKNSSGFSAIPNGTRGESGVFGYISQYASWWSSSKYTDSSSWFYYISSHDSGITEFYNPNKQAHAVRCVKD